MTMSMRDYLQYLLLWFLVLFHLAFDRVSFARTKMLSLLSFITILSTVGALISRDSDASDFRNVDLRILPLGGEWIEIREDRANLS